MFRLILVVAAFFLSSSVIYSQTLVSGEIVGDVVWNTDNNPYILSGDVTIMEGSTLSISENVEVFFQESNISINSGGELIISSVKLIGKESVVSGNGESKINITGTTVESITFFLKDSSLFIINESSMNNGASLIASEFSDVSIENTVFGSTSISGGIEASGNTTLNITNSMFNDESFILVSENATTTLQSNEFELNSKIIFTGSKDIQIKENIFKDVYTIRSSNSSVKYLNLQDNVKEEQLVVKIIYLSVELKKEGEAKVVGINSDEFRTELHLIESIILDDEMVLTIENINVNLEKGGILVNGTYEDGKIVKIAKLIIQESQVSGGGIASLSASILEVENSVFKNVYFYTRADEKSSIRNSDFIGGEFVLADPRISLVGSSFSEDVVFSSTLRNMSSFSKKDCLCEINSTIKVNFDSNMLSEYELGYHRFLVSYDDAVFKDQSMLTISNGANVTLTRIKRIDFKKGSPVMKVENSEINVDVPSFFSSRVYFRDDATFISKNSTFKNIYIYFIDRANANISNSNFIGKGHLKNSGTTGTINAENNWWGDISGPTHPSNPEGKGFRIEGDVNFIPWSLAPFSIEKHNSTPIRMSSLGNISVEEDFEEKFVALLDTVFSDTTGSFLEYEVFSSNLISPSIRNEKQLFIKPVLNAFGDVDVIVKAMNEEGAFIFDTLKVFIEPVNDAPQFSDQFPETISFSNTESITYNLSDLVSDPEDDISNLTFFIETNNKKVLLSIDYENYSIRLSAPNYSGEAILSFTVLDSENSLSKAEAQVFVGGSTDAEEVSELPKELKLLQNYPNPFNPATQIEFALPKNSKVILEVFNSLGQRVSELVNTNLSAGNYNYTFKGDNLSSGVYIYRLEVDGNSLTRKMQLIK